MSPRTFTCRPTAQETTTTHQPCAHGGHCATQLAQFADTVHRLPVQQRSLDAIQEAATVAIRAGVPWEILKRWLTDERFDLKRADAHAVVVTIENASCS